MNFLQILTKVFLKALIGCFNASFSELFRNLGAAIIVLN